MQQTFGNLALCLTVLVLLSGNALSAEEPEHRPANTSREWLMLMHSDAKVLTTAANQEIRLIRSPNDWKYFLDQAAKNPDHPLGRIDKSVLREFTESLLFGKFGIATAYVGGIEKELSHFNYVRLWEHFGMTEWLTSNTKGYKCPSAGNMALAKFWICTSNCYIPGIDGLVAVPM